MIEKNKILKAIDEAIDSDSTSPESKEILKQHKQELIDAKTKEQYSKVILKILDVMGAIAKFGSAIAKIFAGSG